MPRAPPRARSAFDSHLHLTRWWPDLAKNAYRQPLDYTLPGLLREMDKAGIGGGLLIPVHEAPTSMDGLREALEHARKSGGRLRAAVTVDPTPGKASVDEATAEWEAHADIAAVKLFPGYLPFYPRDPALVPVYEFAARRKIPVLFHQGDTLDPGGLLKFARPIEVDEVAVRYRDVAFVLCHFGNPWIEEAAEIVYKNENVYADTSGFLAHPRVPYFERMVERMGARLRHALDTIGSCERILYGSDWPLEALSVAVGLIGRLDLSATDRTAVLGGNARRLFRVGATGP